MTHRISTEEQGNETNKFGELLERISGTKIQPHKSLDVSPVAFTSHPEALKRIIEWMELIKKVAKDSGSWRLKP